MDKVKRVVKDFIGGLRKGNNPNFLIIGAQKAGTSSLYNFLGQHPDIVGSNPKEIHYFDKFINYPGRSINWYKNHFKTTTFSSSRKFFFEATPNYLYYESAAKKIKEIYPDIRLVVILRDPISRAFSAWNMYYSFFKTGRVTKRLKNGPTLNSENLIFRHLIKDRKEFPSFEEAIQIELRLLSNGGDLEPAILRRGLYFDQILTYLKYFTREQFLFLKFSELQSNPLSTCNKVLDFVGIDSERPWKLNFKVYNKIEYEHALSSTTRSTLEEFYKDPNSRLFEFMNCDQPW